jgi:hypothetical protein
MTQAFAELSTDSLYHNPAGRGFFPAANHIQIPGERHHAKSIANRTRHFNKNRPAGVDRGVPSLSRENSTLHDMIGLRDLFTQSTPLP